MEDRLVIIRIRLYKKVKVHMSFHNQLMAGQIGPCVKGADATYEFGCGSIGT